MTLTDLLLLAVLVALAAIWRELRWAREEKLAQDWMRLGLVPREALITRMREAVAPRPAGVLSRLFRGPAT